MSVTRLEKPQWQPFFDRVSAALGAETADIVVVGPHGSKTEARGIALTGLSYDARGDLFAMIGEDLEHNIEHPARISVDEDGECMRSLEVFDAAGDYHILRLKDPLRLPAG